MLKWSKSFDKHREQGRIKKMKKKASWHHIIQKWDGKGQIIEAIFVPFSKTRLDRQLLPGIIPDNLFSGVP